MSGPDGIDERFRTLVGELRSGEVAASRELRERIRAIARREPEPPTTTRRLRRPRWRLALVLVPVAAALAVAVGVGAFSSGESNRGANVRSVGSVALAPQPHPHAPASRAQSGAGSAPFRASPNAAKAAPAAIAPSGSRHQLYSTDLRLRVSDLSATTKQAIRLTRGWGGYVLSVDYGSAQASGEAHLVLRIPIVKVQTAIARLASLGTILADHTAVQDIQGQFNRQYSRMQALRVQITKLRAKLTDPSLTASQRAFFEAAIAQREGALANLQKEQQAQATRTSFATVSLDLQTRKAAAAPPSRPGRIGQALHNIGRVLVVEAEVLLYVLLIGAPFAVLAVLLWLSRRTLRRRAEKQLLAH